MCMCMCKKESALINYLSHESSHLNSSPRKDKDSIKKLKISLAKNNVIQQHLDTP